MKALLSRLPAFSVFNFSFVVCLFIFFIKRKDKAASHMGIIGYDAVMMQQNIFQGET